MAFKLEWSGKTVSCHWSGVVKGHDLVTANRLIHSDARFDDLRYMLFLMADIEQVDVTIEDVEKLAAMGIGAAKSNSSLRCATVSTDDDWYGLSSFYQMHMDEAAGPSWSLGLFKTREAAEEWLFDECFI
ncbi:hypothetical protein [Oceanicoccus sagamiensis]|uniref:STAS/SEC14 domain-containing protein n=1 Tax=Oceanicoccus sagamiensis TaxID=716816 RepID=A0A1X9NFX0_9GAMM|nr:hypothetical protein [Oceanicoccus sagamiensis]ARN74399.1 hypothetical protein BST96_09845 [Oceanicoccus sagamiensis]